MKEISLIGSTGSIGTAALAVIGANRDRFKVAALGARHCSPKLVEQVKEFQPKVVALAEEKDVKEMQTLFPSLEVLGGKDGIASLGEIGDIVLLAIVGVAGLEPAWRAVRAKKRLAIATKEVLVTGGEIILQEAKKGGAEVIPVDSEHSAIFQCLQAANPGPYPNAEKVAARLVITASGGPFLGRDQKFLENVTPKEALKHPTWKMGAKISVDSATMMNKGLEVIEAARLFNFPAEKIEVVVHPQSIIHSLVEFQDGSLLAQLSNPDMRLPIQYALTFPERVPSQVKPLSLTEIGHFDFLPPDFKNFPCLTLAFEALRQGGIAPAVLNGANEAAVQAFLQEKIKFTDIPTLIEKKLSTAPNVLNPTLDDLRQADAFAREGLFN